MSHSSGTVRLTAEIARIGAGLQFDDLPDDVIRMAKLALLDNLGCALRGVKEPLLGILAAEVLDRQPTPRDLLADTPPNTYLPSLALLYGAAAHAIDYDDTFMPARAAHTGSAVIGALMPQLRAAPYSGRDLLTAVVVGYEVSARIGELLSEEHYLQGFHPTCTIGVFGAAAAAARLMGLDAKATEQALGLAATQAAGLKCTFGTMAKPFNAGNAAASGLQAARLVARGFTAPLAALEADKGYLDLFLGRPEAERAVAPKGQYFILQTAFKAHAACHAIHPMIEAISAIRDEQGIGAEDVEALEIYASTLSLKTASIDEPGCGLDCKFSFSQVAAFVLLGMDTSADETYCDAVINDPAVNACRGKVTVLENPELSPSCIELKFVLTSGRILARSHDLLEDMPQGGVAQEALQAKFLANAVGPLGEESAERLCELVLTLDQIDDCGRAFSRV